MGDKKDAKPNKLTILLIVVAVIILLGFALNRILKEEARIRELNKDQAFYNEEIEKLKKEKQEILERKDSLENDEYIENMARNKLDMFLPNERVFVYSQE